MLEAEVLGFDSVLVAQHTANPHIAGHDQLEAWTASAALAALTERIEIITAIKPYIYHPVFLAKMALQIENISRGRFAFNLVNAWNRPEFEKAGIAFGEHDERYAYGREWISIVERLIRGEEVTHKGPHFDISAYRLAPKDLYRERPLIYVGGESEPARALAAAHADVFFLNGQPIEKVRALIDDALARPRPGNPPLRFGLAAFVIARESEADAERAYQRLLALAQRDAPVRAIQRSNTDPKAVMFQNFAKAESVGTNGGTAAGLVGTYDQVADRLIEFGRSGIELFMLQFQPLRTELQRFATEVLPRVRARETAGALSPAARIA